MRNSRAEIRDARAGVGVTVARDTVLCLAPGSLK